MTKRIGSSDHMQDGAPMDQVRELLFGAQMKEVDTRFQRQEERFERKVADVRDALKARLDSLENFMKSETVSLLHRLKEEQAERDSALKTEQRERTEALRSEHREREEALAQIAKELTSAVDTFERKITKVADTLDATERELRQLMMTENSALSQKIEEKYQDALQVLGNTAAQIRADMVHRSALSGMFTETALKLSGQWSDLAMPAERGDAHDSDEAPSSDDA